MGKFKDSAIEREQQVRAVNRLLRASQKLEEVLTMRNMLKAASLVRQIASQRTLALLEGNEMRGKYMCRCGRWLRDGDEIAFYMNACTCYNCDSGYSDYLDEERERIYE